MIIVDDVEQGSDEWLALRLGIPTASNADALLTPTGKKSTQATMYGNKLVAEWVSGEPIAFNLSAWIERGRAMEAEARAFYEFERDTVVRQVGFCYGDESRSWGCSPDGLVGDDGMIEVKCPSPWYHVEYLLGGDRLPSAYVPQVQFSLMTTGRAWCDFISYHPDLPPAIVRIEPDAEYIEKLRGVLDKFLSELEQKRAKMRALGCGPA